MGRASAELKSIHLGLYDHRKENSRIAGKEIVAEQREGDKDRKENADGSTCDNLRHPSAKVLAISPAPPTKKKRRLKCGDWTQWVF